MTSAYDITRKYVAQLLDILWQADIGVQSYPIKPDFFNDSKMVLKWTKTVLRNVSLLKILARAHKKLLSKEIVLSCRKFKRNSNKCKI